MSEKQKEQLADAADMIVSGFAFQKVNDNIRVVNLNTRSNNVMIMTADGKPLESDMDPIERVIALQYWDRNREFMEN